MPLETNGPANIIMHLEWCEQVGDKPDLQYIKEVAEVIVLYMGQVEHLKKPWHSVVEDWKLVHKDRSVRWD